MDAVFANQLTHDHDFVIDRFDQWSDRADAVMMATYTFTACDGLLQTAACDTAI